MTPTENFHEWKKKRPYPITSRAFGGLDVMSVYYRNSGIITHYVRHVKAVLTEVKLRIRS